MSQYKLKVLAAALGCLCAGGAARAMTQEEAAANLLYFAHAVRSGERCKQLGFAGHEAAVTWRNKNGAVFVTSIEVLKKRFIDKGADDVEAFAATATLYNRFEKKFDLEFAPRLGKSSCAKLGETLSVYESKLVP
jgi:hypothetical protein